MLSSSSSQARSGKPPPSTGLVRVELHLPLLPVLTSCGNTELPVLNLTHLGLPQAVPSAWSRAPPPEGTPRIPVHPPRWSPLLWGAILVLLDLGSPSFPLFRAEPPLIHLCSYNYLSLEHPPGPHSPSSLLSKSLSPVPQLPLSSGTSHNLALSYG